MHSSDALARDVQSIYERADRDRRELTPGENAKVLGLLEQARAAKALEPYKTVEFDDGCDARELNSDESRGLEDACARLGYTVEGDGS